MKRTRRRRHGAKKLLITAIPIVSGMVRPDSAYVDGEGTVAAPALSYFRWFEPKANFKVPILDCESLGSSHTWNEFRMSLQSAVACNFETKPKCDNDVDREYLVRFSERLLVDAEVWHCNRWHGHSDNDGCTTPGKGHMDERLPYAFSEIMLRFYSDIHEADGGEKDNFCFYGLISALWVMAQFPEQMVQGCFGDRDPVSDECLDTFSHNSPDWRKRNLAAILAQMNMGKEIRYAFDFIDSSNWPFSGVEFLGKEAKMGHTIDRIPVSIGTPQRKRPTHWDGNGKPLALRIWEVGVHASLSAEPVLTLARVLRPRAKVKHRNLIKKQYPQWMPDKCQTLYEPAKPWVECDTKEDDLTHLMRKYLPRSDTAPDAIDNLKEIQDAFQIVRWRRDFADVDFFLCTIPYLCLIFQGLGKPVMGYFGHPLLFMVPDNKRHPFWSEFQNMAEEPGVLFTVSDPFLQMQYEYQVHIKLPAIRTHGFYTHTTYLPTRAYECLVLTRPWDVLIMGVLQNVMDAFGEHIESTAAPRWWQNDPQRPIWKKDGARFEHVPLATGGFEKVASARQVAQSEKYPFRFLLKDQTKKTFRDFASFRAVIIFPYDMDLMSFYEFYSMSMPIFMPTSLSKYIFHQRHVQFDGRADCPKKVTERNGKKYAWQGCLDEYMWSHDGMSPFEEDIPDSAQEIVKFTDYVRFPHVQGFKSLPDLLEQLPQVNIQDLSRDMKAFNEDSIVFTERYYADLLRCLAPKIMDTEAIPSCVPQLRRQAQLGYDEKIFATGDENDRIEALQEEQERLEKEEDEDVDQHHDWSDMI